MGSTLVSWIPPRSWYTSLFSINTLHLDDDPKSCESFTSTLYCLSKREALSLGAIWSTHPILIVGIYFLVYAVFLLKQKCVDYADETRDDRIAPHFSIFFDRDEVLLSEIKPNSHLIVSRKVKSFCVSHNTFLELVARVALHDEEEDLVGGGDWGYSPAHSTPTLNIRVESDDQPRLFI